MVGIIDWCLVSTTKITPMQLPLLQLVTATITTTATNSTSITNSCEPLY